MRELLRQLRAFTCAEWLRQTTSPVWAVLLGLWTLVCAIFLVLVVAHIEEAALPPGESPTSFLLRSGNSILALLLVVFVPQLCCDAMAGRRANGRLEHLLIGGCRPTALLLGSHLASWAICLLLALPLLLIHFVLAGRLPVDFGHTAGGSISLLAAAGLVAALALAIGSWAPSRTSAGLAATALGLIWWLLDQIPDSPLAGLGLSLSRNIRQAAGGHVDLGSLAAMAVAATGLLAIARLGLLATDQLMPRLLSAVALAVVTLSLLTPAAKLPGSLTLGAAPGHLSAGTLDIFAGLNRQAPVEAVLVHSQAMQEEQLAGPMLAQLQAACAQLQDVGVSLHRLDTDLDSRALAELLRGSPASGSELAYPLLFLRHADRQELLGIRQLAVIRAEEGRAQLQALRLDEPLAAAGRRLAGQLPQVAWLDLPGLRRLHYEAPHRRDEELDDARRLLAGSGNRIVPVGSWQALQEPRYNAVVVPGLAEDLPENILALIDARLQAGGRILLSLDGRRPGRLQRLRDFLHAHGIVLGHGLLHAFPELSPGAAPVVHVQALEEQGPVRPAGLGRHLIRSSYTRSLHRDPTFDDAGLQAHLALPTPLWLYAGENRGTPLRQPRQLLITRELPSGGRLAVLAGTDLLGGSALVEAGNGPLARGILHWLCSDGEAPVQGSSAAAASRGITEVPRAALWILAVLLPLGALGGGLSTWWWRRRR